MEDLIIIIVNFIEKYGTAKVSLIGITIFIVLMFLLYLSIVIESYSQNDSLFEILLYRKYQVKVQRKESSEAEIFVVRAWGRINAVEKVGSKLNSTTDVVFEVTRL